jgi:hypothetical protein
MVSRPYFASNSAAFFSIAHLILKCFGPEVRVFNLDLVDDVDAEIQVDRFIAQDVLILLCNAHHLIAMAKGEDPGRKEAT